MKGVKGTAEAMIALYKYGDNITLYSDIPGSSARICATDNIDCHTLTRLKGKTSLSRLPFKYDGRKTLEVDGKSITAHNFYLIDNPVTGGAHFVSEPNTQAEFLDRKGNKTFTIGWLNKLKRRRGQLSLNKGLLDYEFVAGNKVLDFSGRPVAKLDDQGFFYES